MSTYTKHAGPNGREIYQRNNLLISPTRVPQEVADLFSKGLDSVDYDDQPNLPRCLFCDDGGSFQRTVGGVTVVLCNHHYYSKNIGQLAQKLREDGERHGNAERKSAPKGKQSQSRKNRHGRRHAAPAGAPGKG